MDALEQVERLEACDDDGHAVLFGDGPVLLVAHHGADVAGREKPLDAREGRGEDRLDGRRHEDVGDEYREVGYVLLFGLEDGHGVGGCGGLEAHGEEDDLPVGAVAGDLEGVQRGVNHSHVAARGLRGEEVPVAPRHPEHVPERGEDHAGARRDVDRLVYQFEGRDTDGAARPVEQGYEVRQQLVDAVTDNGVGLAATHLHDGPRAGGDGRDLSGVLVGQPGVPVLVQVLHSGLGPAPLSIRPSSSISLRYPNTSRASFSSSWLMAKPAWTIT